MKNTAQTILTACPPYVLGLVSFAAAVAFGLFKLYALLKANGLG